MIISPMEPRNVFIFAYILAIALYQLQGKRLPNFAGPYTMVVRRVVNVTDEFNSTGDMWSQISVTHHKPGQPQYRWGVQFNRVDISDNLMLDIRVSKWANNQWKQNAFLGKFHHGCTDTFKFFPSAAKFLIGTDKMRCPIKPGIRPLTNQTVDVTGAPHVPVLPYARYRFTGCYRRGSECVGLISAEIDVEPRL